ncbi:hypothetical protein BGZ95_009309 [Linnemannia exigua]|uniref:Uncharacterized protein n=1 Tax=Linnemannia exigua TaxID=604196 RepID=A0AAD4DES9_9FUNG|nr:hypothetical protein BGZ95_009309 [Linnemannia exigua]
MPVQWRRVDDLAWSEIFKQDTADVAEEWIRTKFANHGRHIRHLSIQFNIVEIIVQTEECRHLVSLTAHSLPFKNFNSLPSALARSSLKLQQQRLPFIQSLSPIFERAYLASQASSRITRAQFLEFYPRFTSIPMSFWLLIQQNPGLVSLTLPSVRVTDSSFSEEIIYSALSILKNLKELNVGWIKVDVLKTLQRTPQLELLRMDRWNQLFSLTQDFPGGSSGPAIPVLGGFQVDRDAE